MLATEPVTSIDSTVTVVEKDEYQEPEPASRPMSVGPGGERSDLRNLHVREDLARAGRCANVHLATGRTSMLPSRHYGPCQFFAPQDAVNAVRL